MKQKGIIILISSISIGVLALGIAGSFILGNHLYNKFKEEEMNELIRKEFEFYYNEKLAEFRNENESLNDVDISFVGD